MKYLITGGGGFIGTNLTAKLLSQGHQVVSLDNLYSGLHSNIQKFEVNENFKFVLHDVVNEYYHAVDFIVNLACPASPIFYQSDPIGTFRTSVMGTINALELARKLQIPLIQASTSEIYGDPLVDVQNESYWGNVNPIGIRSCYDEGKRGAESLCFDYRRKFQIDVRVVRIFNTYGPFMRRDDGRVVSNFINQAIRNEDITIYGDGSQTRSFCYVDDLVDGLVKAIDAESNVFDGPINLGNPAEFTIQDLAAKIITLVGSNSEITRRPLPLDDPMQRKPDIARANKLLGWNPKVELDEGLIETIDFFKKLT